MPCFGAAHTEQIADHAPDVTAQLYRWPFPTEHHVPQSVSYPADKFQEVPATSEPGVAPPAPLHFRDPRAAAFGLRGLCTVNSPPWQTGPIGQRQATRPAISRSAKLATVPMRQLSTALTAFQTRRHETGQRAPGGQLPARMANGVLSLLSSRRMLTGASRA